MIFWDDNSLYWVILAELYKMWYDSLKNMKWIRRRTLPKLKSFIDYIIWLKIFKYHKSCFEVIWNETGCRSIITVIFFSITNLKVFISINVYSAIFCHVFFSPLDYTCQRFHPVMTSFRHSIEMNRYFFEKAHLSKN